MTDIRRDLLLQQPGLVLALLISHLGLFLLAWVCLGRIPALRRAGSILLSLTLSTSATPAFGIAVLQPFLGHASEGTVGLIALAINLVTPLAITRGKDRRSVAPYGVVCFFGWSVDCAACAAAVNATPPSPDSPASCCVSRSFSGSGCCGSSPS